MLFGRIAGEVCVCYNKVSSIVEDGPSVLFRRRIYVQEVPCSGRNMEQPKAGVKNGEVEFHPKKIPLCLVSSGSEANSRIFRANGEIPLTPWNYSGPRMEK